MHSALVSYKLRRDIGYAVIAVGWCFWFWFEVIVQTVVDPSFPNFISYSPFLGQRIPEQVIATSLSCVAWFQLSSSVTWDSLARLGPLRLLHRIPRRSTAIYLDLALAIAAILGWIPLLLASGGFMPALDHLQQMRKETLGLEAGFANYLPILSIASSSIALARLTMGHCHHRLFAVIAVLFGGSLAIFSGTRFKLFYLVFPAILGIHASYKHAHSPINFIKKNAILAAVAGIVFALAFYQVTYRTEYLVKTGQISWLNAFIGAGHFSALTHAVGLVPSERDYFYEPMLPFFVTDYIPRFIWPEKPEHSFWEFYNKRLAIGGNLTPSIVAQYYMNWGPFGSVLAGIIIGAWARFGEALYQCTDIRNHSMRVISGGMVLAFVFLSYRVLSPNYFTYPLIAFMFFIVSTRPNSSKIRMRPVTNSKIPPRRHSAPP